MSAPPPFSRSARYASGFAPSAFLLADRGGMAERTLNSSARSSKNPRDIGDSPRTTGTLPQWAKGHPHRWRRADSDCSTNLQVRALLVPFGIDRSHSRYHAFPRIGCSRFPRSACLISSRVSMTDYPDSGHDAVRVHQQVASLHVDGALSVAAAFPEASRFCGFWVCWCRLGASCHEECAGGEVVGVGEAVGGAA